MLPTCAAPGCPAPFLSSSLFTKSIWRMLLLWILLPSAIQAQSDFTEIYDYSRDWLVYDLDREQYVPYTPSLHKSAQATSILINLRENQPYVLIVEVSEPHYVFMDGALYRKLEKDQRFVFKIDSLIQVQPKEQLLLTLYGGAGHLGKKVWMGYKRVTSPTTTLSPMSSFGGINLKPLKATGFTQFSVLIFVLLVAYNILVLRLYPFGYTRILAPLNYFSRDERSDLYKNIYPLSGEVFMLVTNLALLAAYLLVLWGYHDPAYFFLNRYFTISAGQSALDYLSTYMQLIGGLIVVFYLKYILMRLIGNVLRLDNKITFHYIKALQSSTLFLGVLALLGMLLQLNQPLGSFNSVPYLVSIFIFYLIRFGSLYLLVNNRATTLNLYLFSYLCIVEIIPLIVGLKMTL